MKSIVSLGLVVAIVTQSVPMSAQAAPATPIAPVATWDTVRTLAPGTQIAVTRKRSTAIRYVVLSGDSELLTLKVDPALPVGTIQTLVKFASAHPEAVTGVGTPPEFVDAGVRVASDGVFLGGRRFGEFERIAQTEDVQIRVGPFQGQSLSAKKPMSTGAKVAIAVGILIAVVGILFAINGCNGRGTCT
jgi:hypothetical protein